VTRLVVFDLDEVLWSMPNGYCALMSPPLEVRGRHVTDANGLYLELREDAVPTLDALRARGFSISVASRSRPVVAAEILRALGLLDYFLAPCFEWQDKDLSLARILGDLERGHGLRVTPEEVLFVDDWPSNVRDAVRVGVRGVVYGRDVKNLSDVVSYLDAERASADAV